MSPELQAELDRVRQHFEEASWELTGDGLVALSVWVQGVEVQAFLHPVEPLERPPALHVSPRLLHVLVRRGRVRQLDAQRRWNRTLGVSALLRELDQRFREDPPVRRSDTAGVARYLLRALLRGLG